MPFNIWYISKGTSIEANFPLQGDFRTELFDIGWKHIKKFCMKIPLKTVTGSHYVVLILMSALPMFAFYYIIV